VEVFAVVPVAAAVPVAAVPVAAVPVADEVDARPVLVALVAEVPDVLVDRLVTEKEAGPNAAISAVVKNLEFPCESLRKQDRL